MTLREDLIVDDRLLSFAVFADTMNLTRAAALLHVSQPALHMKLKRFSSQLGVALYQRLGSELVLTPDGQRLAVHAREVRRHATSFLASLEEPQQVRTLTLIAGEGTILYVLQPMLQRLFADRALDLRLLTGGRDAVIAEVRAGNADIGVTVADDLPKKIASRSLRSYPLKVALPAEHRLAARKRLRIQDIASEPLVVPAMGKPYRSEVARLFSAAGQRMRVGVEASGWPVTMHLVSLGFGIALINGCVTPAPGVVVRPLVGAPVVEYSLLWKQDSKDATVERALALILEHADHHE